MTGSKKESGKGAGKKEQHVERLTNEELDKVSGGKVCLICQPQHENKAGKVGCSPTSTPWQPKEVAPQIHICGPTGGCGPTGKSG